MPPRSTRGSAERPVTVFLPDGAVTGFVMKLSETGMTASLEAQVPPDMRHRFSLGLPNMRVNGEVVRITQDGRVCKLQFVALRAQDRLALRPFLEEDE